MNNFPSICSLKRKVDDFDTGKPTTTITTPTNSRSITSTGIGIQVTPEGKDEKLPENKVLSLGKCWSMKPEDFRFFTGVTQEFFLVIYRLLGGDEIFRKLKVQYKLTTPSKAAPKFKIPLEDRLFLTLVRLRRGTPFRDLGFVMGLSKTQAGEIFYSVLRHMFLTFQQFKDRMFLTAKDQKKRVPKVFKPFKNLKIIVDGAEFRLQVPSFSNRKIHILSTNQVIPPISSLESTYTEESPLLVKPMKDVYQTKKLKLLDLLEPGDAVMADRGFEMKAQCMTRKIKLIRPSFLGQRDKLSPKEVLFTKAIAKARIYEEHTIGKIKAFRLLR
ncbi:Replication termination factor 1 [Frankliniella fusca]|uniref:Replication termination factor 1 n=1 Tax=Frankliniella fusca TaxID=407009 RepID=A0AAE1LUX4_9NEOP|nr:Replication termination factor 1 [Frankliniella fusca]